MLLYTQSAMYKNLIMSVYSWI